jgi:hypothetical protein
VQDQEQRKDNPWLPALLPLAAFGVVAIVLPTLGMFLLTINYATEDMFHAPWPHSTAVIIVALFLSFLIAGSAAFVATRPERPKPPSE